MKNILVPTDFSANAHNAIVYAMKLFAHQRCQFTLLHTYSPAIASAHLLAGGYSALQMQEITQKNAETNLEQLANQLRRDHHNPKHSFRIRAAFNMLVQEMKQRVEEDQIDLIVMGTQGATGAKEIFLGTNTMYAIKKIACPILAVPPREEHQMLGDILFPTDFKLSTSNPYLELVRQISVDHAATIHMLKAYYGSELNKEQSEVKDFLTTFFKDSTPIFHIEENTDVIGAIDRYQINYPVHLLVMIHNKHHFFENLLFTPVINQMVYHTQVPFLVVPSVERQGAV